MDTGLMERYEMLPPGCGVLCAVSGGADSVYLLYNTLALARTRNLRVRAAHYDHGLRGEASAADARFVEELCAGLNVPLTVERGDVAAFAAAGHMGIEEAARTLRYEFLERTAEITGCDRIATAHTADDNAETILMNLARGAGTKGLCGIQPVRGRLIRPMLLTTRREVEEYLAENRLPHVEDASNALDDYARNRVRHHAVPALRGVNGQFARNASRAAELLRADEEYLESLAADFVSGQGGESLSCAALTALPRPVSSRAVRLLWGGGLSEKHVDAVLALAKGRGLGAADLPGLRVEREQGRLRASAGAGERITPVTLTPGACVRIPGTELTAKCDIVTYMEEIHSSLNTFFFQCENICGNISCTSRTDGDKIRLTGRGCTKNLSDLFTERGMTQRQRDLIPVFRDEAGPVAVFGFGSAERCAPQEGKPAFRIYIEVGDKL